MGNTYSYLAGTEETVATAQSVCVAKDDVASAAEVASTAEVADVTTMINGLSSSLSAPFEISEQSSSESESSPKSDHIIIDIDKLINDINVNMDGDDMRYDNISNFNIDSINYPPIQPASVLFAEMGVTYDDMCNVYDDNEFNSLSNDISDETITVPQPKVISYADIVKRHPAGLRHKCGHLSQPYPNVGDLTKMCGGCSDTFEEEERKRTRPVVNQDYIISGDYIINEFVKPPEAIDTRMMDEYNNYVSTNDYTIDGIFKRSENEKEKCYVVYSNDMPKISAEDADTQYKKLIKLRNEMNRFEPATFKFANLRNNSYLDAYDAYFNATTTATTTSTAAATTSTAAAATTSTATTSTATPPSYQRSHFSANFMG